MREPLNVTEDTLREARAQVADLAETLKNARDVLTPWLDEVTTGCGSLADAIEPGAAAFALSWDQVLTTATEDAQLIARNIGALAVDVAAVDVSLEVPLDWRVRF